MPQESAVDLELYQRFDFVMDQLDALVPTEARTTPQAVIVLELGRGFKKDIRMFDPAVVANYCRQFGEALAWIADGKMEDLNGTESDNPE